jgi:cysteine sulfinate desulfinase/cysteine desulfurase-like protein
MGIPDKQSLSTLRISFGRNNTKDDIEILINELTAIING